MQSTLNANAERFTPVDEICEYIVCVELTCSIISHKRKLRITSYKR
jgi:hypothetical protein